MNLVAASVAIAGVLATSAHAQSMQQLLKRKYDIQEQQAKAAQAAADAERARVESSNRATSGTPAPSGTYSNLPTGDPLEGTDATSCKLANGAGIKVSGTIRTAPGSATKCD